MLKKTILATLIGSTLLASSASFADPYYRHGHGYGHREVVVQRYYQPARPVVVQRYYQARPVIVERRVVVQRPAPVYAYGNDGLAILAGAVLGGAIAYQIANH
ncbi:MAG TPA: hypothetical protein VGO02_07135 [Burkholderiales bacterium]|jgi:hypothetical protein|nr:hypothetical protein [Burkholderiales bacterium]